MQPTSWGDAPVGGPSPAYRSGPAICDTRTPRRTRNRRGYESPATVASAICSSATLTTVLLRGTGIGGSSTYQKGSGNTGMPRVDA